MSQSYLRQVEQALKRYKEALGDLDEVSSESKTLNTSMMEVLFARDALQVQLNNQDEVDKAEVGKLLEIDRQVEEFDEALREKGKWIAGTVDLEKWRTRREAEESAWWWFFEAPIEGWDRFDWMWTALTAGVLALTASFIVSIYQAIAAGNADIAATFSVIIQAAGLAVVGRGAFSLEGQEKVEQFLEKMSIPSKYQAEATLILASLLLASVFLVNHYLDDYYYDQGRVLYEQGSLNNAALAYEQGIEVNPAEIAFHNDLGRVYESMGLLQDARLNYRVSAETGNPDGLNNLARTLIKEKPLVAQTYLLMALQRAELSQDKQNTDLSYQLRRNLGWVLLQQEKYDLAAVYLTIAIRQGENMPELQGDRGMAYCFLAEVHEAQNEIEKAQPLWQKCIEQAKPEFLEEYKWFLEIGKDYVAYCVDSSNIVGGYERDPQSKLSNICDYLVKFNSYDKALEEILKEIIPE